MVLINRFAAWQATQDSSFFSRLENYLDAETAQEIRNRIREVSIQPTKKFEGQQYSLPCYLCTVKTDGRIILSYQAAQMRFSDGLWFWVETDRQEQRQVTNTADGKATHWMPVPKPPMDVCNPVWNFIASKLDAMFVRLRRFLSK